MVKQIQYVTFKCGDYKVDITEKNKIARFCIVLLQPGERK